MRKTYVWKVTLKGHEKYSSSAPATTQQCRVIADDFRRASSMAQELAQRETYALNSSVNFEVALVEEEAEAYIEGEE